MVAGRQRTILPPLPTGSNMSIRKIELRWSVNVRYLLGRRLRDTTRDLGVCADASDVSLHCSHVTGWCWFVSAFMLGSLRFPLSRERLWARSRCSAAEKSFRCGRWISRCARRPARRPPPPRPRWAAVLAPGAGGPIVSGIRFLGGCVERRDGTVFFETLSCSVYVSRAEDRPRTEDRL